MFVEYFIIEFSFQVYEKNVDYFIYNYFFYIHNLSSNRGSNYKLNRTATSRLGWFEYFEQFGTDCIFFQTDVIGLH